jgi:hypothetical protein
VSWPRLLKPDHTQAGIAEIGRSDHHGRANGALTCCNGISSGGSRSAPSLITRLGRPRAAYFAQNGQARPALVLAWEGGQESQTWSAKD